MTTIVASTAHGIMVADSKVTIGKGISYPTTKIVKINGSMIAGAAGHAGDCSRFLEWATDDFKPKSKPKFEDFSSDGMIDALVLKKDGIYFYSPGYPSLEKINAEFYAIGSGGKPARAALLMGADPVKAAELACQVDDYSGLPLLVLEL
jgi:ATP-dependent protease HslVU (ClpYQ) peptidase subunit